MQASTRRFHALARSMCCALVLNTAAAQTMPSSPQAPAAPAAPGMPSLPGMPPPAGALASPLPGQQQPHRYVEREMMMRQAGPEIRSMHDMHGQHQRMRMMHQPMMDPVDALKSRLDRVANDLHLKADQQADWEALRKHLLARAQQAAEQMKARRAAMMQGAHGLAVGRGPAEQPGLNPQNLSPDQAIGHRAQRLRDQANQLEQTAALVKVFHEKLSPEQRTIMRLHRELRPARMRAWQPMRPMAPAMPGFGPADGMRRGAIPDEEFPAIGGLAQSLPMMAMLETVQGFEQEDVFDEAVLLIR